jgi:GH35 family endo-1,4-beta-xylanase
MNRRAFLKLGAGAAAGILSGPDGSAQQLKRTDEDIATQAKAAIEEHRKASGSVTVRDVQGHPVPGVRVTVEQLRHDFLFGCNFFMFGRCRETALEEQYRGRFAALLNYCTLGFYWNFYEARRGKPNYDYTDEVAQWTRDHGILCKGHPLVWDHPAGSPAWLPDDAKEIERLSLARVREIVSRYRGRIQIWDVVNEATHLPDKVNQTRMAGWAADLGPIPYVAEHLRVARAANPQATLLVNDYRTDPPYYKLLDGLRDDGRLLFDAVGIQSHMHGGLWTRDKTWNTCQTYAKLGLPIHFTETTILSGPRKGPGENWGPTTPEGEAGQAEQVEQFYRTLFSHPAVRAITWWDFADLGAWQGAPAGWLRRDLSPKPVYEGLLRLIKGQWWTKAQGTTDPQGRFELRAFFGAHRITAELPGGRQLSQEVLWQRAQDNQFELKA